MRSMTVFEKLEQSGESSPFLSYIFRRLNRVDYLKMGYCEFGRHTFRRRTV